MDQKAAIAALGALAQETRLDVFRLLVTIGPVGLPAGVIAERLGVLPSSLTFHLNLLHRAGLVSQTRRSRQLIYAAEYSSMNELLAYLTENCCGGGQSCAPACDPTTFPAVMASNAKQSHADEASPGRDCRVACGSSQ